SGAPRRSRPTRSAPRKRPPRRRRPQAHDERGRRRGRLRRALLAAHAHARPSRAGGAGLAAAVLRRRRARARRRGGAPDRHGGRPAPVGPHVRAPDDRGHRLAPRRPRPDRIGDRAGAARALAEGARASGRGARPVGRELLPVAPAGRLPGCARPRRDPRRPARLLLRLRGEPVVRPARPTAEAGVVREPRSPRVRDRRARRGHRPGEPVPVGGGAVLPALPPRARRPARGRRRDARRAEPPHRRPVRVAVRARRARHGGAPVAPRARAVQRRRAGAPARGPGRRRRTRRRPPCPRPGRVAEGLGDPRAVVPSAGVEELRRLVAPSSLVVAIVAALVDPSSAGNVALAAIPVLAFAGWGYTARVPLAALTVAVVVPVVLAERSGDLEPLLFEVSLLAVVVAAWADSLPLAAVLGAAAVAAPIVIRVVQPARNHIGVGPWILGIVFPWVLGLAVRRQAQLTAQLDTTRRALAEQALLAERRQIARDVHDFVGHGLAAVMLQITSARHVLRRDPEAAEEALRTAEDVGRRSMRELRRTVALLRSDDEDGGVAPPLPSAGEISALVDEARAGGLDVDSRVEGDLALLEPGVGLALYRIAQEALANAARHAAHARTVLEISVGDEAVTMAANTVGPVTPVTPVTPAADHERRSYGVVGMRERASALGGELSAGPTVDGWRVSCRLPLSAADGR